VSAAFVAVTVQVPAVTTAITPLDELTVQTLGVVDDNEMLPDPLPPVRETVLTTDSPKVVFE
jgi:hypothetical protein